MYGCLDSPFDNVNPVDFLYAIEYEHQVADAVQRPNGAAHCYIWLGPRGRVMQSLMRLMHKSHLLQDPKVSLFGIVLQSRTCLMSKLQKDSDVA